MSDIKEPVGLAKARTEEKLFEFQLSLRRLARKKLELQYEMDKITENEVATLKEIAQIEATLK
jgi:hypothetical protein